MSLGCDRGPRPDPRLRVGSNLNLDRNVVLHAQPLGQVWSGLTAAGGSPFLAKSLLYFMALFGEEPLTPPLDPTPPSSPTLTDMRLLKDSQPSICS